VERNNWRITVIDKRTYGYCKTFGPDSYSKFGLEVNG
jgi:hypothetical protein